jgi:hypothetical protein
MATKRIPFEEWLPDLPSTVGSLLDATNVYPVTVGYAPFPSPQDLSNASSDSLNNVFAAKFNLSTQLFAGSSAKLYKFNPNTLNLDDTSKSGGYSGNNKWSFTQFGKVVLASNGVAKVQAWTIGSSSAFADVAAAAPVARFVTVVRDFVVAANLDNYPNKLQWSDINDETNWTSGNASQSDFQIISEGGNIVGISGGEFGLVLLEKAIVRMSYIGSPYFFQFDTISRNLGCNTAGSITQYGGTTYFLADNGFYACDGTNVIPIGNSKVDDFFYENMNVSQQDSISSAIDPIRNIVVWNYPNTNGGRSMLVYNWILKKWSLLETTTSYVASLASTDITLEGLDAYGTIENLPASMDDRIWAGGKFLFGGIKSNKIVTFTGTNTTAILTVGDLEFGYNSVITLGRAQIDLGSCQIAVASRRALDGTVTYSTAASASSEGRVPLRSAGRYHRVRVTPTGSWKHAISVDVDYEEQGTR